MAVLVTCNNCGEQILVKDSIARRQSTFSCSNRCRLANLIKRNKDRVRTLTLVCPQCSREFQIRACDIGKYRFCSLQCRVAYFANHPSEHPRWQGGLLRKICPVCQSSFYIKRSHFNERIYCSRECYMKVQSERQKGDTNPAKREVARKKIKQSWVGRPRQWVFLECPVCKKVFRAFPSEVKKGRRFCSKTCSNMSWAIRKLHPKPNKPERALQGILDSHFPEQWKYTGDGSSLIGWFNPDFVNCNGQKAIIELFGEYWHSTKVAKDKWEKTELGCIMAYNSLGYRCLIIWDYELKDEQAVVAKVKQFMKKEVLNEAI